MNFVTAIERVRANMGPDLIPKKYRCLRPRNAPASWGNCYPASEALYHLWGKRNGWRPGYIRYMVKNTPATHWVLIRPNGHAYSIIDITGDQFPPGKYPNPNSVVGCGFLTKRPSKRARILMRGR